MRGRGSAGAVRCAESARAQAWCGARRVRVRERFARCASAAPSNGCKFQIQNCGAGVRATTNENRNARVRAKALDREYVLALLEYGGSIIVFVKSDREPRILEIVSDFGAKSDPKPRNPEIVSDFGAKSNPKPRICETVSDSGAKSDPKPRTPETVSDFGAKSDSKLQAPKTESDSCTKKT